MTVTLYALLGAAFTIDASSRLLVADVRLAMKRADLSIDYVARVIGVAPNKLSDQLNGKTLFTAFARFGCDELRRETEFWLEFTAIQAERVNRELVRANLGELIAKVEELISGKRMLRMALPVTEQMKERA
jgi:hypothetical protein